MIIPKPTLQMLFTTSRVITAVYRIVSTTLLLAYIARRATRVREPQHERFERRRYRADS